MKSTRILAYEVSKKLDEQDLENIAAAGVPSAVGPSFLGTRIVDVRASFDL